MTTPTYYDILKVAPDAPPEIIKAAYRALCQKYHPDKFLDDTQKQSATQMMVIINRAYQTLSNPYSRQAYDEQLAEQKDRFGGFSNDYIRAYQQSSQYPKPTAVVNVDYDRLESDFKKFVVGVVNVILRICRTIKNIIQKIQLAFDWFMNLVLLLLQWLLILVIMVAIVLGIYRSITGDLSDYTLLSPNDSAPKPVIPDTPEQTDNIQNDISPITINDTKTPKPDSDKLYAPNGERFPNSAGHIKGYPKLRMDGLSTVTIENTQNDSAIFGKLIYLGEDPPQAVRHFYIPAGGGLILRDVTAGTYDVRYKDLDSGSISKTESFELSEYADLYGSRYSEVTMTLYKVLNGNMQTTTIPESQF